MNNLEIIWNECYSNKQKKIIVHLDQGNNEIASS